GDLHALGAELLTELVNDRHLAGIDQASTAGAQASLADGLRDGGAAVDRINDRPVHPVDLLAILLNLLIGERIIGTGGHAHLEVPVRSTSLIPDAGVQRCAIFAILSSDCTSRIGVWGFSYPGRGCTLLTRTTPSFSCPLVPHVRRARRPATPASSQPPVRADRRQNRQRNCRCRSRSSTLSSTLGLMRPHPRRTPRPRATKSWSRS